MNTYEDDDQIAGKAGRNQFQFYNQSDIAWPRSHTAIRGGSNYPAQLEFSKQERYNYLQQYGINTKYPLFITKYLTSGIVSKPFVIFDDSKLSYDQESECHIMRYSNKVHTIAWTTIASATIGLSLSAIGLILENKFIGIISAFSIAICGITLIMWIESAIRERNIH